MKKILITGSTGFLGSRLAYYLKDRYELWLPTHAELNVSREEECRMVSTSILVSVKSRRMEDLFKNIQDTLKDVNLEAELRSMADRIKGPATGRGIFL